MRGYNFLSRDDDDALLRVIAVLQFWSNDMLVTKFENAKFWSTYPQFDSLSKYAQCDAETCHHIAFISSMRVCTNFSHPFIHSPSFYSDNYLVTLTTSFIEFSTKDQHQKHCKRIVDEKLCRLFEVSRLMLSFSTVDEEASLWSAKMVQRDAYTRAFSHILRIVQKSK